MKKSLYCIVLSICMRMWFVCAQSISFVPEWDWVFWYNCLVPIDVYVDANWQEVAAMDLVMETSLKYKDFVPTEFFPYFFPPVIKGNWLIHIVGFSVDTSERVTWRGKVGTLYFEQNDGAIDGAVRLYFLGEWKTADTNLSILWWIDVLKEIGSAYVTFSDELEPCEIVNTVEETDENNTEEIQNENIISWGFSDKTQEEIFQETFEKIEAKYETNMTKNIKNKVIVISLFILLLAVLLLLIKNILSFEKESGKWKSKPKHKKK